MLLFHLTIICLKTKNYRSLHTMHYSDLVKQHKQIFDRIEYMFINCQNS